jgi:hypothetical protein
VRGQKTSALSDRDRRKPGEFRFERIPRKLRRRCSDEFDVAKRSG